MTLAFHGTTLTGLTVPRLEIERGDIIGVSGRSGSGKSRLMRALADLDRSGLTITLDGVPRRQVQCQSWRARILYCAATPAWWEDDQINGLFQTPAETNLIEEVGLDRALWSVPMSELSTGEQQRAHVARYLAMTPDVMMLDEPTSALDAETTQTVERLIASVADHAAVLLTSHDPAQLDRLANRRWHIRDSQLEKAL